MISTTLSRYRGVLADYSAAISGSIGRLVFSLIYFVALANTLSISEFGLFATAVATGIVLSRIGAFGFVSPLYRIATVKPRLIGTYTAGYLVLLPLSLPFVAVAAFIVFHLIFAGQMDPFPFILIIIAEVLFNRGYEIVMIVNNGMGRFGRGAIMAVIGTLIRAGAALMLSLSATPNLDLWSVYYLIANAAVLVLCAVLYYPRQKLRLRPQLYWRRLQDATSVAVADILFYLQMELDKLLVLSLGGAKLAGIYAIIMRLVDLTAMPIRIFNMMFIQSIMRDDGRLRGVKFKTLIETGIFLLSVGAIFVLAGALHFYPTLLGKNVAQVAPLLGFALLIPGFRNLVEYHAELLYARGQTIRRTVNLAILALAKGALLVLLLAMFKAETDFVFWANAAFAALYAVSLALTYPALKHPAKRI